LWSPFASAIFIQFYNFKPIIADIDFFDRFQFFFGIVDFRQCYLHFLSRKDFTLGRYYFAEDIIKTKYICQMHNIN